VKPGNLRHTDGPIPRKIGPPLGQSGQLLPSPGSRIELDPYRPSGDRSLSDGPGAGTQAYHHSYPTPRPPLTPLNNHPPQLAKLLNNRLHSALISRSRRNASVSRSTSTFCSSEKENFSTSLKTHSPSPANPHEPRRHASAPSLNHRWVPFKAKKNPAPDALQKKPCGRGAANFAGFVFNPPS